MISTLSEADKRAVSHALKAAYARGLEQGHADACRLLPLEAETPLKFAAEPTAATPALRTRIKGGHEEAVNAFFNKHFPGHSHEDIARATGAIDGSTTVFHRDPLGNIVSNTDHPNLQLTRKFVADGDGVTLNMHNQEATGELLGQGHRRFNATVEAARKIGLKKFVAPMASGSAKAQQEHKKAVAAGTATEADAPSNGYHTWFRYGFNGPMLPEQFKLLSPEWQAKMEAAPGPHDFHKLYGLGGGDHWRDDVGTTSVRATFDLGDNSPHLQRFRRYYDEREANGGKRLSQPSGGVARPQGGSHGGERASSARTGSGGEGTGATGKDGTAVSAAADPEDGGTDAPAAPDSAGESAVFTNPTAAAANALAGRLRRAGLVKTDDRISRALRGVKKFRRHRYSAQLPAHPLVAGFRIEHALRHLTTDPVASQTTRLLAKSVLHPVAVPQDGLSDSDVLTESLHKLHDSLRDDDHPMAEEYDWAKASHALYLDDAVQHAAATVRPEYFWHPDPQTAHAAALQHFAQLLTPSVGARRGNVPDLTKEALDRVLVDTEEPHAEVLKSVHRLLLRHSDSRWPFEHQQSLIRKAALKPTDSKDPHVAASRYRRLREQLAKYRSDALATTFNTEFGKVADRLHQKHGVADIDSFKADPWSQLLRATRGDTDAASDAATHLLYGSNGVGAIETNHKPGEPLKRFLSPFYVRGTVERVQGITKARSRGEITFTDAAARNTATPNDDHGLGDDDSSRDLRTEPKIKPAVEPRYKPRRSFDELVSQFRSVVSKGANKRSLLTGLNITTGMLNRLIAATGAVTAKEQATKVHGRRTLEVVRLPEKFARDGADFVAALRRVRSRQQQTLRQLAVAIHKKLKLSPATVRDAIHDGPLHATATVAQSIWHPDSDHVKLAAAWLGLQTQTPSLTVFTVGEGADAVHRISVSGSGERLRATLDRLGLPQRTLLPTDRGYDVLLFDPGSELKSKAQALARVTGGVISTVTGTGEVIGGGDGPTADSSARRSYRAIITKAEQGDGRQQQVQPAPQPSTTPAATAVRG